MCSDFSLNKSAVRTKNCSLNMPADQPSTPGCRTDGAINRCMGSVSATSGPDTELQVPDEILQNFGMKTSFSKDVPKLPAHRSSLNKRKIEREMDMSYSTRYRCVIRSVPRQLHYHRILILPPARGTPKFSQMVSPTHGMLLDIYFFI